MCNKMVSSPTLGNRVISLMSRVSFRRSYLKVLAVAGAIVLVEDVRLSDLVGALL
jgi:hypothetical protein